MGADRGNMVYHIENQIADSEGKVAGKIYESEVEVSSAELLALATTAKELVPVPGTGKVLEFISATIRYIAGSTGYTESTDDMVIRYSGGQAASDAIDSTNFIDQTDNEIRVIPHSTTAMAITVDLEALKNTALQLFIPNDNPTLGNGTLNVRTTYRIHDFN